MNRNAYEATKAKNAQALEAALTKEKVSMEAKNSNSLTLLHLCAGTGFAKGCELLLVKGRANINATGSEELKETPLHHAAKEGQSACLSVLLGRKADPNSKDAKMRTPLHYAVMSKKESVISQLLVAGADADAKDYRGNAAKDYCHRNSAMFELMNNAAKMRYDVLVSRPGVVGKPNNNGSGGAAMSPTGDDHDSGEEVDLASVSEELEKALEPIIGMDTVKEILRGLLRKISVDKQRAKLNPDYKADNRLNMLFLGNPGTGKTCMARIVASMLKLMGILGTGTLVEVSRKDLVAEYIGQSAQKTLKKIDEATGGVLFIDEAYSLKNEGGQDQFGQEVVDTLVQEIENRKDKLIVIMAGYNKEMSGFLQSNSGLASRFPITVDFPNYSYPEMCRIMLEMVKSQNFHLSPELTEEKLADLLQLAIPRTVAAKGNARSVRNLVDAVVTKQTNRMSALPLGHKEDLFEIKECDIRALLPDQEATSMDDVMAKLDKVIGVPNVKDFMRSLRAQIQISQEKKAAGLPADAMGSLHMIFQGNPGTGKTTIARIIGEMLRGLGIVSRGHLIETTRADFVGEHVGETAVKTLRVVERAVGGVLFIDEAYTLVNSDKDSYGREALDAIMKAMEDMRDELIVILAGYPAEMNQLVAQNPGIKSRISNVIDFPDYTTEELMAIGDAMLASMRMTMKPEAKPIMHKMCETVATKHDPQGGNGRFVRNVLDKAKLKQAQRLCRMPQRTPEDLTTLLAADFENLNI